MIWTVTQALSEDAKSKLFSINNLELALCIGAFAFPEGEIETVGLQKVAKFGEVAAVIPHSKGVDIE